MATTLIIGNPVDGLRLIGPFDDAEAATLYAERCITVNTWWVAELQAPFGKVDAPVMAYYTAATNQDGELDVQFYTTSQACDAALDALEQKQRDRDILGYTGGKI